MTVRRLLLGAALFAATVPLDFACSKKDDGEKPSGDGGGDGDIQLPSGGMGGGDGDAVNACPSFVGLSNCGSQGRAASRRKVNLLLVIDKSGSMDDVDTGDNSRWAIMKAALQASLQEVQLELNVGLSFYPYPDNELMGINKTQCGVVGNCCEMPRSTEPNIPVGFGLDTVPEIVQAFDRVDPGGGTPTSIALDHAYDYFVHGTGKDLEGDKYVILATDGGPNCNSNISCETAGCTLNIEERPSGSGTCEPDGPNCCTGSAGVLACLDDVASEDAVSRLASSGIDTFVVGIPGSEAYAGVLDNLAVEGGRALSGEDQQYYRVSAAGGVDALTQVFRRITQELVTSCDIQLDENPPNLNEVNVAVDCEIVPPTIEGGGDGGAGGQSGSQTIEQWVLDPVTNPPTLRLRGELCDRVQAGVDRVDVVLGCPPVF
jgi:hypothetical protein